MKRLLFALAGVAILSSAGPHPAHAATASELAEAESFAIGNMVWVLYHEIGHFLVSEFGIPMLGREEDAVDHLATVILLEQRDAVRANFLVAAVDAFFLMAEHERRSAMFEGHGLDEQRAYQVACLMYGSDPAAFTPLADSIGLPPSRRALCPHEYQRARTSWYAVLAPYRKPTWSASAAPPVVDYADQASPGNAQIAGVLHEARVLEVAAEYLAQNFTLRSQPVLRVQNCGSANAFFDPNTRVIGLCYELYSAFHDLLIEHLSGD